MSLVQASKAKNYYRSFKTLIDTKEKSGKNMTFGKDHNNNGKAINVSKVTPQKKQQVSVGASSTMTKNLKGGL